MEFLRKLLKLGGTGSKTTQDARGAAPVQSQEEQDATRVRMEAEMAEQRERRNPTSHDQ